MPTASIWSRIGAAGLLSLTLTVATGCEQLREDLLAAEDPDIINPVSVTTPEAADALRIGALERFRSITAGGEGPWQDGGLLVDEWKSSNTFFQHNETDQRQVQESNSVIQNMLRNVYRARTNAREAILALEKYKPEPVSNIAQMYFVIGFAEMSLAETFCNGTPLGDASAGAPVYGPPLTNAEVFAVALAHLDTALAKSTGTDSTAVSVRHAASVAKGRVLLNLGRFADAATAVAGVASTFQWRVTFSLNAGSNNLWNLNTNAKRFTVGDSFDTGGLITNALPFASAGDPRIPVTGTSGGTSPAGKGFDTFTNFVYQRLWGRTDPTPVVSGLDARLIEAEVTLKVSNDIPGMMTILNSLRASAQNLGALNTPVMAALQTPANTEAAIKLYFREKAFWTFGRGQRLPDLRRLVRQYSFTQDQVFPTGQFFKGGTYASDVNLPVTVDELNNPEFTGCLDRSV
jgi:hypothetical protein